MREGQKSKDYCQVAPSAGSLLLRAILANGKHSGRRRMICILVLLVAFMAQGMLTTASYISSCRYHGGLCLSGTTSNISESELGHKRNVSCGDNIEYCPDELRNQCFSLYEVDPDGISRKAVLAGCIAGHKLQWCTPDACNFSHRRQSHKKYDYCCCHTSDQCNDGIIGYPKPPSTNIAPSAQLPPTNTTQSVTTTTTTPGPVVSYRPQGATPGMCDCSGNGVCERNASYADSCRCHKGFHGEHCQCVDNKCPQVNNQPCGGQANGQCSCSVKGLQSCSDCSCTCNPGYMLNSRTNTCCPISDDACRKTIASLVCSGNGECNCGLCECFGVWQGKYCDSCVGDENHCPTLCHLGLSCAQAPAECFGKRCCRCSGNVRPVAGGTCNNAAGCYPIRCGGMERLAMFPKYGTYAAPVTDPSNPNTTRIVQYTSCPVRNGQCLTVLYVAQSPYDTSQFLPLVTYTNPECSRSSAARLISQLPVIPFVIFFTLLKKSCVL